MTIKLAITSPDDFAKSLDAELQAFLDFIQVLQTEQEALIQGNVDFLIELAQLKSEKVVLLSQYAMSRSRFLDTQGCAPELGGMGKWLRQHNSPHIAEVWRQLLEHAEAAQQLNKINGVMIETKLRNNQQALSVLQAAANKSTLYGPDGQTHAPGMGRPLGKG
ncbi:MAG: flagellar protein FlgN [Betaproteobacteria bacterium]|nr:flagellar protein FlgN [Betaproteobacteria bacterium]